MTIGAPIEIYRRRRRVEFIGGGVLAAAPTSVGRTKRLDPSTMFSMIEGIELILPEFISSNHENIGETDKIEEIIRKYFSGRENFRDQVTLSMVPRKYLNNLIAAAKFSDHINSNFLINFSEKVKSNKRLCSNYEIAIIKMEKIISYKTTRNFKISDYFGRTYYERRSCMMDTQVYKFKHPRSATCARTDSECGFILRDSAFRGTCARTDSECGFILRGSAFRGTLKLCTDDQQHVREPIASVVLFSEAVHSGGH